MPNKMPNQMPNETRFFRQKNLNAQKQLVFDTTCFSNLFVEFVVELFVECVVEFVVELFVELFVEHQGGRFQKVGVVVCRPLPGAHHRSLTLGLSIE